MDLKTKRMICLMMGIASILTIVSTISYAYFSAMGDMRPMEAVINTATVSVKFSDNDEGIGGNLNFGESITKKFTIENTGTADASIRMSWVDLINTYLEGSLTYTLSYSENESGPFTEVISKTNVPRSSSPSKRTLAERLTVPVGETYYYSLEITLNYLSDVNQDSDLNAIFNSKFGVEDINAKYQVVFDANGGTVEVASKTITENEEYGTFPIPTMYGYEFVGWFTEQEGGEQIIESSLVENSANHTLYAHWKLDTVMMTVPLNYNEKMWSQKESIKKVVFETSLSPKESAIYTYDISSKENGAVMSYLVPDAEDNTKYIAYIQANEKIIANPNSSYLFYNFTSLESIEGLENLDTSNVTNMRGMFHSCESLRSLDLSSFNTNKVTAMNGMFYNCKTLTELKLDNFDTTNVVAMQDMFNGCNILVSLDLSHFDTSNVTDMSYMFFGCHKLTSLDVSNFDTGKVTNMRHMFYDCVELKALDVSKFDTSKVTNMQSMFESCRVLTSLDVSNFDTSKVTNMQSMFRQCNKLTSLEVNNFDTSNVTNMAAMFSNCKLLTLLNVSNFNTSNVTDMRSMFRFCSALTSLKLNNFDTRKVTDMAGMFGDCTSLTSLDIGSFNTSDVTTMAYMFGSCTSLTSLNLSSFNTGKVTTTNQMFSGCTNLSTLDMSNFDMSNVTDSDCMFLNTRNSIKITVGNSSLQQWVIDVSDSPKLTTSNVIIG